MDNGALPGKPTDRPPLELLVTGGTGVLGRAFLPLAAAAGHVVEAPSRRELDLFAPAAVAHAVEGVDAVLHLATRIGGSREDKAAWRENDRLRIEASRNLVDASLRSRVRTYVQPTVTFVYRKTGPVDELLRSALSAEGETLRFAAAGRRGVVLRFGLLDGPGTGNDEPEPRLGATLHVEDAGRALLAALTAPSGIYNVCRDGEGVSNAKFGRVTGWRPNR
jgi:nucleoside-diphosphate-sugar epimerase